MCLFYNASFFLQISLAIYCGPFMAVMHTVMKDGMYGKGFITTLMYNEEPRVIWIFPF